MDTGTLTVARVMSRAPVVVDPEESPLPADLRRPHTTPGTPLADAVAAMIEPAPTRSGSSGRITGWTFAADAFRTA